MSTSRPVALLMRPDSGYYRGVLRGIKAFAEQTQRWVFGMAARTGDLPLMLSTWRPAGVLAFTYSDEAPEQLATFGIPVVSFANIDQTLPLPMVGVDDVAVGQMAAQHLLERGFRHFAFAGCPIFHYSNQREQGYNQKLAEAGLGPAVCFHDHHAPDAASVWAWTPDPAVKQWLLSLPRPVGMLAANDATALRLSELCRQLNLRIPEDIALLGVDDDDLFCTLARPALSSVKTPLERIGYEAAWLLDRLMSHEPPPPSPILLPPMQVITRRSTDVLAIEDQELADAVRFIHSNASQPIGVKQLLEAVPVSRRSLERRFRATFGRTPLDEILRVRLQRAQTLLSGTDLPISVIAEQTGFITNKQLTTTFQKRLKTSPTAYRRQFRLQH